MKNYQLIEDYFVKLPRIMGFQNFLIKIKG
jgi:hypothetical protein